MIGFPQQNSDAFLFKEIGAAILTTAIGLFMRQILVASDQAEEAQDRIFRSIAEEVRKDTVQFHETQKVFVALVKEFVDARETMFSDEEKAFAEYLKALKDGALRLGALPKRVETVLAALEKTGVRIAEISTGLETGLSETAERLRRDVDSVTDSFVGSRKQLGDGIVSLAQVVGDVAKQIEAVRATIGQSALATEQIAKTFGESVSGFSAKVNDARQEVDGLVKNLGSLANDLHGVDQIMDDLIRIIRDRLAVLSDAFQRERPV
jgi:methyl-accepting chemotaxis protein